MNGCILAYQFLQEDQRNLGKRTSSTDGMGLGAKLITLVIFQCLHAFEATMATPDRHEWMRKPDSGAKGVLVCWDEHLDMFGYFWIRNRAIDSRFQGEKSRMDFGGLRSCPCPKKD